VRRRGDELVQNKIDRRPLVPKALSRIPPSSTWRGFAACCVLAALALAGPGSAATPTADGAVAEPPAQIGERSAQTASPVATLSGLPLRRDDDDGIASGGLFRILTLAAFLAVGLGWLWWRRAAPKGQPTPRSIKDWLAGFTPAAKAGSLRVVQSATLTPRASVHVIQWDGQEWLLGCAEHGLTELGRRAQPVADVPPARDEPGGRK
jgi:hypothetical protein